MRPFLIGPIPYYLREICGKSAYLRNLRETRGRSGEEAEGFAGDGVKGVIGEGEEAAFQGDALGRDVAEVGGYQKGGDMQLVEAVGGEGLQRFGRQAVSPVGMPYPITDFTLGWADFIVFVTGRHKADAAYRFTGFFQHHRECVAVGDEDVAQHLQAEFDGGVARPQGKFAHTAV